MDDVDAFVAEVVPLLRAEFLALENGDAGPRKALWAHDQRVTLFGAEATASGWDQVEPIFDRLAEGFSNGLPCTYEVLGAGVSGDLDYVVAIERSVLSTGESNPEVLTLRITTVVRRDGGQWKVVHRHGDPLDLASQDVLSRRRQQRVM